MAGTLARTTALILFIGVGAFTVVGFILWDADFYVARGTWENFKTAMFGKWQPNKRLVDADAVQTDVLDGVDEINFFRNAKVAGFGTIVTGARFNSSLDVIEKRAAKRWCYVSVGGEVASRHINLGKQDGKNPPAYSDFQTLPQDVLTELGVSAGRLNNLAKANCRFGVFDAR